MDAEFDRFDLTEDFSGLRYISKGQLKDTSTRMEIVTEPLPVKAVAIFMSIFVLAIAIGFLIAGADVKTIFGFSSAAAFCAVMFVAMLKLADKSSAKAKLPFIEKATQELTLPSGTVIRRDDMDHFRQFKCKTKMSNFQLVVTTIVTREKNQQYAVIAETGNFNTAKIGTDIAKYFDVEISQSPKIVKDQKLLEKLALN